MRVSWSGETDCCIKQTVQEEPPGEGGIWVIFWQKWGIESHGYWGENSRQKE